MKRYFMWADDAPIECIVDPLDQIVVSGFWLAEMCRVTVWCGTTGGMLTPSEAIETVAELVGYYDKASDSATLPYSMDDFVECDAEGNEV